MRRWFANLASVFLLLWAGTAAAVTPEEQARLAELERTRAEIADQLQLLAYDLIDEMVYSWTQEPVFDKPTPVVLAGATVPVGLGTGLAALVETHVGDVIGANPQTNVQLVHCPTCTAVVVHSGPEGTVVSRGYDNADVLEQLGEGTSKHALFVDFEAEGATLVMRARLTRLTPDLPIVWAQTVAASSNTPALLRSSTELKSAEGARQEYLDVLSGKGPFRFPLRLGVRNYAQPTNVEEPGTPPPPFLWLQTGVEFAPTDARAWTSSLIFGGSFIPQAYQGLMGEARISRLVTGRSRSLTRPDIYLFTGASVQTVWGQSAASFQQEVLDAESIIGALQGEPPRHTLGTLQIGADVRMGNRVGITGFLETMPWLRNSQNIGDHIRLLGIGFQTMGFEVAFWF